MKFFKLKNILIVILLAIGVFIACHSTAELATRTHIFIKGYPLEAFGKAIPTYVVIKKGFLFFAKDYGSANTP